MRHNAIALAAYCARTKLRDYRTGFDYDKSADAHELLHSEIIVPDNAPEWAVELATDREKFWNAVEAREDKSTRRKDAQCAREIDIAIPHQLSDDARTGVIRRFVQEQLVSKGLIADVSWHAPPEEGDHRNYHAHVMVTTRTLEPDGFGNKIRGWNEKEKLLIQWREAWAKTANAALEREGIDVRLDHRSYEDRGIDKEPGTHDGPIDTDRKRRQRARQKENEKLPPPEPEIRTRLYPTDEKHREMRVQSFLEAQDAIEDFKLLQKDVGFAGERQRDARRKLKKVEWQIEQEELRVQEHRARFEKAIEIAYQNPEEALGVWHGQIEKWQVPDQVDRGRWTLRGIGAAILVGLKLKEPDEQRTGAKSLGRLRGFNALGFKSPKRRQAEFATRQMRSLWQKVREANLRNEVLSGQRDAATQLLETAERNYTHKRKKLGGHKERTRTRNGLFARRSEALKNLQSSDIWESQLPEEQQQTLAREWEQIHQRKAERVAECESVSNPKNRQEFTDLWDEERAADEAAEAKKQAWWNDLEKRQKKEERERTKRERGRGRS